MKVTVLEYTRNADRLIASAGRTCYSDKSPLDLFESMTFESMIRTLGNIHGSVFEHATVTFSIEGISRVTSHQLVRHREASYSQQSQRYVDIHKTWENMVIPESVKAVMDEENELSDTRKDEHMNNAIEGYKHALETLIEELDKHGIESEDIRYFVPQGTVTNMVVTMNFRELIEVFFSLRCCNRAQWEIREVANLMLNECKSIYPNIFKNVGASCKTYGSCPEHKPCKIETKK